MRNKSKVMRSRELENETTRSFERTHSWIKFDGLNLKEVSHKFWMMIGDANSKCQHLANSALPPEISAEMYKVYLVKGVQATTSIEGNTLSEAQVSEELAGTLELPKSQEYQRIEVKNILNACQEIVCAVVQNKPLRLTPEVVRHFNSLVLEGLETREGETAEGAFRTYSVGVGTYKAPPWEDCPFLVERLCEWLNGPQFVTEDDDLKFLFAFLKAVVAHLYIAWIHPFADGNGRTARLIEFQLLTHCSFVPLPAAHVLSNYYNKTRQLYYRELDRSHRETDGRQSFLLYSLRGFVEGLGEQLAYVRAHSSKSLGAISSTSGFEANTGYPPAEESTWF